MKIAPTNPRAEPDQLESAVMRELERPPAAVSAQVVNRARDEALARACFSKEEHARRRGTDLIDAELEGI